MENETIKSKPLPHEQPKDKGLSRPLWVDEVNHALDELNAAHMELELGAGNIESAKSGIDRAHTRLLHALACAPQSRGTNVSSKSTANTAP